MMEFLNWISASRDHFLGTILFIWVAGWALRSALGRDD